MKWLPALSFWPLGTDLIPASGAILAKTPENAAFGAVTLAESILARQFLGPALARSRRNVEASRT